MFIYPHHSMQSARRSVAVSLILGILATFTPSAAVPHALAAGSDVCTPETSSLIAYWKLDESSASDSVIDTTGNGNTGTAAGTGGSNNLPQPTTGAPALPFMNDHGKNFDGSDDVVTFQTTTGNFDYTDTFSVSAWVNPSSFSGYQTIAHKVDDTASARRGYLLTLNNGLPEVWIINDIGTTNYIRVPATTSLSTGSWQNISVTYDGSHLASGVHIYKDGSDVTGVAIVDSLSATTSNSQPFEIGGRSTGNIQYFAGSMDDVRVFNDDLSASQIARLAAGRCGADKLTPSLGVSSDNNPSMIGETVTFTATITGGYAPSGTVTFKDGATVIGTGTLTGGTATLATSSLAVGTHDITGVYNGDNDNESVNSSPLLQQIVQQADTTVYAASASNPSTYNNNITFSAVVYGYGTPTGTVEFYDSASLLGTGALAASGTGAQASYIASNLTPGTHSITAIYTGDTNNKTGTSSVLSQLVNQSPTTTVTIGAPNPSIIGDNVTFNVTITGVSPTGYVSYYDSGALLGTGAVVNSTSTGATSSFATSSLTVGSHSITAVYEGDSNNLQTSSPSVLVQIVNKSPTTTVTIGAPNASIIGQLVTFSVTITGVSPTGYVTYYDGATPLGTGAVVNTTSTGAMSAFSTSALSVGNHNITAVYEGDSNNLQTSSPSVLVQVVNQSPTSTVNLSVPQPSVIGTNVTFTATISGYNPTGTVSFYDNTGSTLLGTGTVVGPTSTGATATFSTSGLAVGTHSIIAIYNGDINNQISSSNAVNYHVVNPTTTTTMTISDQNPVTVGTTIIFTATVEGYHPTGTVEFLSGSVVIGTGSLAALSATGSQAMFATNALNAGNYDIYAHFLGDVNNYSSSSSPALLQIIDKSQTTTVLTSSENPINLGANIDFTVNVSGYFPSGNVSLTSNDVEIDNQPLDGSGNVVFHVSSFAAGTFTVVAHYEGDYNNYSSDSDPIEQKVIGGVNSRRFRFFNLIHYLNGLENVGFGSVGLPSSAFGGPGRGNGDGDLTAEQLATMCSIRQHMNDLGYLLDVTDYMAEIYANNYDVDASIIANILRTGEGCGEQQEPEQEAKAMTKEEKVLAEANPGMDKYKPETIVFAVAEDGYPVSSDPIWNACIRNYQVFQPGETKPVNCNRFHQGHLWSHPDMNVSFKWSDRFVKQIKVKNMEVATVTVDTPKDLIVRETTTSNLNLLAKVPTYAKSLIDFVAARKQQSEPETAVLSEQTRIVE